jgi:hypothetical protein
MWNRKICRWIRGINERESRLQDELDGIDVEVKKKMRETKAHIYAWCDSGCEGY